MNDRELERGEAGVGLCSTCRHVRWVRSREAVRFLLCRLSATDSRFEKYPRLPVMECGGFSSHVDGMEL